MSTGAARDSGGYAGLVSRGAAFVVDLGLVVATTTIGTLIISGVTEVLGLGWLRLDEVARVVAFVISIPTVFAVYSVASWTLLGRTAGKALLGLRVVSAEHTMPRLLQSTFRLFGYVLSAIFLLGFAWIAIDSRRQGFHDKLARTFVVYDWSRVQAPADSTGR